MVLVGGNYTARDLQGQELWLNDVQKRFGLRIVDERSLHTIAGYRKFVVVRHPLDRFVSAFNDKILTQINPDGPFRQELLKFLNGAFSNATEFQRFTRAVGRTWRRIGILLPTGVTLIKSITMTSFAWRVSATIWSQW